MTVKELITELQARNQDAEVQIETNEGYSDIEPKMIGTDIVNDYLTDGGREVVVICVS